MSLRLACLTVALAACGPPRITYVEAPAKVDLVMAPGVATITWEPGLNAATVLVARTLNGEEASKPDGGAVGDPLGGGTILYIGDQLKHLDANLPDTCGPFAWHLWGQATDGTWSKTAATVRSLRGAHTIAPSAEISKLTSVFEGDRVRLQWQPPDNSTAFERVRVLKKVGSAPTTTDDGTFVYAGPSATATDAISNLSATQDTYYAVFNCNSCDKCGTTAPSVAVSSPGDGGMSLGISGLTTTISADKQSLQLSWVTTAPRVKVLRTLNGPATGLTDPSATVVFDGAASSASERLDQLLPNLPLAARTYTYTAWGCLGATCSSVPATTTRALTLRQALQGGGYTLFWRHASAGVCTDNLTLGNASVTTTPNWWKSCDATCGTATAEQLGTAAATELAAVQTFFQSNGIAVSRVLSSEFCRAVRTAQGFQFPPLVEQVPALTYFVYDEANRCRDASSLLNANPAMGTNVAHVGHSIYPAACPILDSLEPGEAAIYRPTLGAPPRYIARVNTAQWSALP
jgi:hypothetical protein